jgi:tetratricopeptide (TPR) repeat protein
VADNPRIEELRRRVQKDPASIAFAQLAEEYRRAGQYEAAIEVARAGLEQHPTYLSARVTLGRALLELGRLDESAVEFESVVKAAPDNLTAVRQLADIHQRRRQAANESKSAQPAIEPRAETKPPAVPVIPLPPSSTGEVIHTSPRVPAAAIDVGAGSEPGQPAQAPVDSVLEELDAWLTVLVSERSSRPSSDADRH